MRQRVVIALALAAEPKLIIADEPTTALDVSIQAQITSLLRRLCDDHGTAVMLVTHDMGVIAETADRVAVMYAGRLVEIGPVDDVLKNARHPYTRGLMGSIPARPSRRAAEPDRRFDAASQRDPHRLRLQPALPGGRSALPQGSPRTGSGRHRRRRLLAQCRRSSMSDALTVNDLTCNFDVSAPWLNRVIERKPQQFVRAVDDISFTVPMGGCLSLVGESGCGKSTVARLVTGLYRPTEGEVRFAPGRDGQPLSAQMIFQDPYASLNPRWRVRNIIAECCAS